MLNAASNWRHPLENPSHPAMKPTLIILICVAASSCSGSAPPFANSRDAADVIRTVVLANFMSALSSEGPIERSPLLVAQEMDTAAQSLEALQRVVADEYSAYDRGAFDDLLQRMASPGVVDVPDALTGKLLLVDDASAHTLADSIAMTGQMLLRLSPVGQNSAGTRAAVILSVTCGPGCGARQIIFLAGRAKRWIPAHRVRLAQY
jgi:hypothetical protein